MDWLVEMVYRYPRADNGSLAVVENDLAARWRNSNHFLYDVAEIDQDMLQNKLGFFSFYGVILPLMTLVGSVGNILGFFVFHHPEMRCLSTMFFSAILISDIIFLIGISIVMSPRAWLSYTHYHPDDHRFWNYLDVSQKLFIGMYPITEMAQCLVVWYTLALAIEQYFVFYHPDRLWKYSTRDKGLQIITTIFIPTVLVHMVHFFKFVRHDVYFPTLKHYHTQVCLSDIYRSQDFQIYEKFLYYIFFRVIPWIATILILPKIIIGGIRHRINVNNRIPDLKLVRVFKSGRSSRITVINIVIFALCNAVSNAMYGLAVEHMEFDQFLAGCHLTPSSRRFDVMPKRTEFLYTFFMVFYSAAKFPLCYVSAFEFRKIVATWVCWPRTNSDKLKEILVYVLSNKSDEYDN